MHVRAHRILLGAVALLAPSLTFALGTIEGFYGITRPPGTSFRSEVSGAAHDPHLFKHSLQIAGGDVLLNFGGPLQIGAIGDVTWANHSASQTALGGLLGFRLGKGPILVDLMGEAGGHRFGNFVKNPDVVSSSRTDQWFAYVGLRPGIAWKFGAPGAPGVILGVWTFVRWDLDSKRVPLTVAGTGDATSDGSVRLGGTTIGATLRLGFDF